MDLCEIKPSLVYIVSYRTGRAIEREPVLKKYIKYMKVHEIDAASGKNNQ